MLYVRKCGPKVSNNYQMIVPSASNNDPIIYSIASKIVCS